MNLTSLITDHRSHRSLACLLSLSLLALAGGCPADGGGTDGPCGTATIDGSAEANNEFTQLSATQCDVDLDGGDMILSIDILQRMTSDPSPRVLLTLRGLTQIPGDATLSLARTDDVELAPAVYQEFNGPAASDPTLADGPFWSSSEGTVVFSTDAMGNVTARFDFTADNPRPDNPSTATGTVDVSGSVLLVAGEATNMCGACGSGAMAGLMMVLAGLTGCKLGLRRTAGASPRPRRPKMFHVKMERA